MVKHSSEIVSKEQMNLYKYQKFHQIKEVSEATVMHYLEKPIAI